ncbi:MAG: chemotaxis protein CheW [Firmicutes bacterium]|jgi:purine-binding chemotaxis protein CheW|nr:chemotaxis protein CheW [Bacillota bacterium]MCL5992704.1 chemotaxis protein CheW [Bacillota bacterium]
MSSLMNKTEEQPQDELQLVAFFLQGEEFAVDIQRVREVLKLPPITPLPQSLDFIEGVINLRGEVIPVIDLRKRFRLADAAKSEKARIIIVEIDEGMVGLIVDSVTEVLHLNPSAIEPPPRRLAGTRTEFISGVGKLGDRLIIILHLEKILSAEEQLEMEHLQLAEPERLALNR